jgi:hypothetical protein
MVAVVAVAAALPATAGQASVNAVNVLHLPLDEPTGASVAEDVSGAGHDGQIGSHVVMRSEGDVGFADFDRHPPAEGIPYGYAHVIAVPDDSDASLDPGSGDFTIEFRFRTKEKFGNVMQKGQARTVGGQVKFQIPKGKLGCMFKGSGGRATATTGAWLLNDNLWHTVRCERTSTSVSLYVDGRLAGRKNGFTGNINNTKPWTMGGKVECDAVRVTCDYFAGEIDYVRMWKG